MTYINILSSEEYYKRSKLFKIYNLCEYDFIKKFVGDKLHEELYNKYNCNKNSVLFYIPRINNNYWTKVFIDEFDHVMQYWMNLINDIQYENNDIHNEINLEFIHLMFDQFLSYDKCHHCIKDETIYVESIDQIVNIYTGIVELIEK